MAIETPTSPITVSEDQDTAALDPSFASRRDAFSVLDHRSRGRAVPAGQALPGHYLAVEDGYAESFLIPLDAKIAHIGRAGTADLRLEDAHVSRRHAIVVRYGNHVRVLDDRSSTGTFVNGFRIIATDLNAGDIVRLGPVTMTYVIVR
jgi:pSer/pThr/pTyr-binding forkhead associated (FHA) protein